MSWKVIIKFYTKNEHSSLWSSIDHIFSPTIKKLAVFITYKFRDLVRWSDVVPDSHITTFPQVLLSIIDQVFDLSPEGR